MLAYFLEYDDNLNWDIIRDVAEKTGYKEGGQTMESLKYTVEGALERGLEQGIAQGMEKGIVQGMEKGIAQGMEKGQRQVALNLLKKGVDLKIIQDSTGLTEKDIEDLKNQ